MKAKIVLALILGFGLGALVVGLWLKSSPPAPPEATATAKQLWTCGMHPQIIQDHPGDCPICHMKLTPRRQAPAPAGGAATAAISIDPVTTQNMGLRTATVGRGPLRRVVRTVGVVDYDETSLADVTTKFKGWIEKLDADTTGQLVHRGEPLFEIYAPDLYNAQTEYVLALKQPAGSMDLLKASALTKLQFFDVSADQIAELEKTGQPRRTLRVLAPRDGVVMEKLAVQGQMVDAGMRLYRIADIGTVWVLAQVYEQDLPYLKLGQEATVTLTYLPDRTYRGRVTYVYPTVDDRTRTAKVRVELHNPGYALKPGMFASVELRADLASDALLVPDTAVLRSGDTNTVFVALAGGRFEPRPVTLGPRGDGDVYQVLGGLAAGDRVVTSGQFLLDSESQLREAILKMQPPAAPGTTPPGTAATTSPVASAVAGPAVYLCPMPEHVSITYRQPGKCPLCGMALVPVSAELLAKIQPGGEVDYYTCPMPEHADVHEAKPGKCPKCNMTMVPVMKPLPPPPAAAPPAAKTWYVCPMPQDADVRSDHPGKCPKCGMDLVPEKKPEAKKP